MHIYIAHFQMRKASNMQVGKYGVLAVKFIFSTSF